MRGLLPILLIAYFVILYSGVVRTYALHEDMALMFQFNDYCPRFLIFLFHNCGINYSNYKIFYLLIYLPKLL